MGSPPPAGSKKEELKFLSQRSIVIAPARTGSERRRRIVVIKIAQTNKGNLFHPIFLFLIFIMVTRKFIDPIIELAPAKCRLNIAMSTEVPE